MKYFTQKRYPALPNLSNFVGMSFFKPSFISGIILCLFLQTIAHAQENKKYPSAILVQLKAERNRTNALIKAKRFGDLEVLRKDIQGAMLATISDFKNHFNYCPVYYFIDTNFDAISEHKFEGLLLNEHLAPATGIVISDTANDYFIVYYGYPSWQTKKGRWDTTKAATHGGHPNGRALIINDSKMRQLNYIYTIDMDFFNFAKPNRRSAYKYISKKFDIEYYPFAGELNRKLNAPRKKKAANKENSK